MRLKAIAAQSGVPKERVDAVYASALYAGFADPLSVTASKFSKPSAATAASFRVEVADPDTLLNDLVGAHVAMELKRLPPGYMYSKHKWIKSDPLLSKVIESVKLPEDHRRRFNKVLLAYPRAGLPLSKSTYDDFVMIFWRFFSDYGISLFDYTVRAALDLVRQSVTIGDILAYLRDPERGSSWKSTEKFRNTRVTAFSVTGEDSLWTMQANIEGIQVGSGKVPYIDRVCLAQDPYRLQIGRLASMPLSVSSTGALKAYYSVSLAVNARIVNPMNARPCCDIERELVNKVKPALLALFGGVA